MLVAANHTLMGVLDAPLLVLGLHDHTGVFLRALGDHLHFRVPIWRDLLTHFGTVDGTRTNCRALMRAGESILVFPGGGREVFKHKREKYRLIWKERVGFVRLAVQFGYPIVPLAAVGAEECYDILVDSDELLQTPIGPLLRQIAPRAGRDPAAGRRHRPAAAPGALLLPRRPPDRDRALARAAGRRCALPAPARARAPRHPARHPPAVGRARPRPAALRCRRDCCGRCAGPRARRARPSGEPRSQCARAPVKATAALAHWHTGAPASRPLDRSRAAAVCGAHIPMRIIDSDQHLYESRTLWLEHIDPALRDEALRIEDDATGTPRLRWRGQRARHRRGAGARAHGRGRRAAPPRPRRPAAARALRRGAAARLLGAGGARSPSSPTLGVDEAVLFPNYGLLWERTLHASLPALLANMAAWNRWCATVAQEGRGAAASGRAPARCAIPTGWRRSSPRWPRRRAPGDDRAVAGRRPAAVASRRTTACGRRSAHHGITPVFHVADQPRPFADAWYTDERERLRAGARGGVPLRRRGARLHRPDPQRHARALSRSAHRHRRAVGGLGAAVS